MTRSHLIGSNFTGHVHKARKLQLGVARDAGDRCPTAKIILNKGANDCPLELFFKIEHVERNTQIVSDATRVVNIVERAAPRRLRLLIGRKPSSLIPQLHREAHDVVSLAL
jgi:hypothetical protein